MTPEVRSFVKASDIVKIFVGDDEIVEVTVEQVQRVKMSKCGLLQAAVHLLKAPGTLRSAVLIQNKYIIWYLYCTISLRSH